MGSSLENMEIYKVMPQWHAGDVTPLPTGLDTFWRDLPFAVVLYLERNGGEIELKDGTLHSLPVGTLGIIPPRLPHRLRLGEGCLSTWAHLGVLLFDAVDVFQLFDLPLVVTGPKAKALARLCHSLVRPPKSHLILHRLQQLRLEAELAETLLSLGTPREESEYDWKRLDRLAPLLRYMEANLKHPLTRNNLAAQLHLSPEWFHQVFSQTLREAPMAYLLRMRLEKASRLLLGSSMTIAEIAEEVGFSDPLYFSRIFKMKRGCSPREYRRLHSDPFLLQTKTPSAAGPLSSATTPENDRRPNA